MSMIKCPECGNENVPDIAKFCPTCGYSINNVDTSSYTDDIELDIKEMEKKANKEFKTHYILSFLFPIIGIIFGIVFLCKDGEYNHFVGKECLRMVVICLTILFIICFLYFVVVVGLIFNHYFGLLGGK